MTSFPPLLTLFLVFVVLWVLGRLRLLSEQGLAAQRSEAETTRRGILEMERVLGGRFVAVEARLGGLTTGIARDQGESRVLLEGKLREMADETARRLAQIQASVNEQLHAAVEKQMQTSFQRVIEQFGALQKGMTEMAGVTAQIGDLKRLFSNVKGRGFWGETQLHALLTDLLHESQFVVNARLREGSAEVVEFAVCMPVRGEQRPLLAMDAKFPIADYERLLVAAETGDGEGERAARRALEIVLRTEGKKIADKYIVPPRTVEFAVMYLPSDGLYAEAARIPGLIDDLGRRCRVMVMGPSLLPALLRTVQLGYVTIALEQKAGMVAELLGATKSEMQKMDEVLEKLAKNAGTMATTIEDARKRTRVVVKKLRDVDMAPSETDALASSEPVDPIDARA